MGQNEFPMEATIESLAWKVAATNEKRALSPVTEMA